MTEMKKRGYNTVVEVRRRRVLPNLLRLKRLLEANNITISRGVDSKRKLLVDDV
jgi:hypothetical protein